MGYQGEHPQCQPVPPQTLSGMYRLLQPLFLPRVWGDAGGMNRVLPRIPWDSRQGYGQGYGGRRESCPCPYRAVPERLRDARALDPAGEAAAISPIPPLRPGGTRVGSCGTWVHHVSWVLPPPPLQGDGGRNARRN